jgi:ubiquinone/menaquinone biosynthesis C-methylase UbiE
MKPVSVFEKYAHEYDILTNAKAREKHHREEVRTLIDRFHPTSVLDAGCATGLTAELFAREGVRTVGLDRSRAMVAEARRKYRHSGLSLKFVRGSFEQLPRKLEGRFDLIVCLANSIAGAGTISNLRRSLSGFRRVLKPGGTLVLQALNYEAVKESEILPVRATQQGKVGYLRYARRRGSRQELTVVRLDFSLRPFKFETFVHEFDNFTPAQLKAALGGAGLRQVSRYGDLLLSRPFRKSSRDIVLTAVKDKQPVRSKRA